MKRRLSVRWKNAHGPIAIVRVSVPLRAKRDLQRYFRRGPFQPVLSRLCNFGPGLAWLTKPAQDQLAFVYRSKMERDRQEADAAWAALRAEWAKELEPRPIKEIAQIVGLPVEQVRKYLCRS